MISIVLAVTNDIVTDNRLHKVANTLINNGYKVTIVGRKFADSQNLFNRPYHTRRFKLWFNKTFLFYANYNLRLFAYLLRAQVDIVVANDLDTLLASWLAAKIRRKVLLFDSHELFTEVPELVDRPFIKHIWRLGERILLPGIHIGYTVSRPIQEFYKAKYNKDFTLIRNVGMFRFENNHIPDIDEKVIIYQGAVNKGRGLELMLETLKLLNGIKLWIVGSGDIIEDLKTKARVLNVEEKVVFIGRVPLDKLWKYTSKGDLGFSLEEDLGLNYRYALPNKIFDFIQARIPVIVSDLPEMRSLVEKYQVGIVLKKRTPENLAESIKSILFNEAEREDIARNLELAARDLCWEREEDKIILLYRDASLLVREQNA
ncbi:MAG: glycosyltransferase [Bacteroidales bacterium]|nr:glycosyltransferase [Bacteroidales bacterium]MBN2819831.1 glycosyltransferase [Bacteroidales bacterium]